MKKVSEFIKDHTPLCLCTLGIAVIGYLGYRAIQWIIHECCCTEKIDRTFRTTIDPQNQPFPSNSNPGYGWSRITGTQEFNEYRDHWKELGMSEFIREDEIQRLEASFYALNITPSNSSSYDVPLGTVYRVPGNFSMWMQGVALVATYSQ